MRAYRFEIARGISSLAVLLLLAACGGGGEGGGAPAVDASKGGAASGVATRGSAAPNAVPAGGAAQDAGAEVGIRSAAAPGGSVGSSAVSGGGIGASEAPTLPLLAHAPDEIIVKFRDRVPEVNRSAVLSRMAGTRLRVFRIVNGLEHHRLSPDVSMAEALKRYRQDPDVLYAEPNYIVRTTATPNDARFGELWGLYNNGQVGGTPGAHINAPAAWDISTGSSGVVIAVIDTGIDYNHPDLSANMFRNTPDCNSNGADDDGNGRIDDCYGIDRANNDSDPLDDNRHGTHVAGTIGAVGNDSMGVVGVNWNVNLMACKFLGAAGSGTTANAIGCLEYVKTMKDRGVNVIATNNSWGGGGYSQALFDAIQSHQQAGILFIAAAGNGNAAGVGVNNDQTPFYPCVFGLSNIICVAATTRSDERAPFSNYGRRTVHIGAPGNDILSTALNGTYETLSGTSMATPHVTGAAALLKASDPTRDWRSIRNLILAGGNDVASMADTVTRKRLNAFGALTCASSPVISRLAPVADSVEGNVGTPIDLTVLNIDCALPNGDVVVTVNPGGSAITLLDNGLDRDQAAGDGNYSGQWTPPSAGNFTLSFPDGSVLAVSAATPAIGVTPASIDFGVVNASMSADRTFTLKNTGSGTLTGYASTTAPFTIASGGTYNLTAGRSQAVTVRFNPPSAGTYSGSVSFTGAGGSSNVVTGAALPPASFAASPASVVTGNNVNANWSGVAAPTAADWVGLYVPGAPNTSYIAWRYTTGTASGTVPLTIPVALAPGTYQLRLFAGNGYTLLAVSNSFTVTTGCAGGALSASPASVGAGGSVTATWSGVCAPSGTDWIGAFVPGAPNTAYKAWRYTTGTASGSLPLTIPSSLAPGTYELRLFANNGATRLGPSNPFVVTSP